MISQKCLLTKFKEKGAIFTLLHQGRKWILSDLNEFRHCSLKSVSTTKAKLDKNQKFKLEPVYLRVKNTTSRTTSTLVVEIPSDLDPFSFEEAKRKTMP
jgi:hypothetical protein